MPTRQYWDSQPMGPPPQTECPQMREMSVALERLAVLEVRMQHIAELHRGSLSMMNSLQSHLDATNDTVDRMCRREITFTRDLGDLLLAQEKGAAEAMEVDVAYRLEELERNIAMAVQFAKWIAMAAVATSVVLGRINWQWVAHQAVQWAGPGGG